MTKMKKIIAIVGMVGMIAMIVPSSTQAATVEELQAQIATLLAQITSLQTQLSALSGGTTGAAAPAACSGVTFDRNLKLGMTGTDVQCMQALLNQSSDTQVAASGAGSPGAETTYFGSLTQAAVVKFQEKYASEVLASYGLTSGTGFVGSTTRAKLTSLLTAGTTGGTTGGTTTPETTLPTAEGLTVTLASDNPIAATIISDGDSAQAGSQALIPYLKLTFSTPAGTSAKVTTLKLKRSGVSTDTDIPNVYLYEGDTKLAEMTSLSLGVVTFTNAAGLFTVSGVKTITVKADLYKDATAGKTIGFGVAAVGDITTDASTVNGTFPINGNVMTTAVVDDFGRLQVVALTNAATVDPGTDGFEAMRFSLTATNQKVNVYSIKFYQIGSIQTSDIANLALYVGGTQIGSTVASLASDGTATFDLSSAPYEILAGAARNVALRVDVIGGSTRKIQFSVQRTTDVVAKDANYGVNIQPDNATIGTWSVRDSDEVTVTPGNLIVSRSTDSSSGNIAFNAINVSLAKFDVKALGENIRVSSLVVGVASTTGTSTPTNIRNVRVYYDGMQVGGIINTFTMTSTSTISLNFTVPVGQTKTVEIRADIQGTGLIANDGIKATLEAGDTNAQRLTSLGSFNFPETAREGNALIVSSAGLSGARNASVGNITAVYNQADIVIGSYLITAGAAEGVDISRIAFKSAASNATTTLGDASLGYAFTNLTLWYGTTQIGSVVIPGAADATSTTYSFYSSPALSLAAGQQIRVDLKANVLGSVTWTSTNATQLSEIEGTGKSTASSVTLAAATPGQGITLSTRGKLSGAIDSSTPAVNAAITAMGETGKVLGIWKLTASNVEDLTVSKIVLLNAGDAASVANFTNLQLYCGTTQFGSAVTALSPIYAGVFSDKPYAVFGGSCTVLKGGNTLITLKSDITSYPDGDAGSYGQFWLKIPATITGIMADEIVARGAGDYASTTLATSSANKVYTYRTNLTAALACNGACTGRTRSATDKIADLTLTGTASADAQLRAALDGTDNGTTGWKAVATDNVITASAVATSTDAGTYLESDLASTKYTFTATDSAATTAWAVLDMGESLSNYSKLSLWLRQSVVATSTEVFITSTSTATAYADANATASSTITVSATGTWTYAEVDLTDATSTETFIGVALKASTTVITYIDAVKVYKDSITVNIGNDATTVTGYAVSLKDGSNNEKAVGYFDGTKVILVPTVDISVGATPMTLSMVADTNSLILTKATGVTKSLSLSINLGTYNADGDIRWWDQANTTPITYLNGASPISISIVTATGN